MNSMDSLLHPQGLSAVPLFMHCVSYMHHSYTPLQAHSIYLQNNWQNAVWILTLCWEEKRVKARRKQPFIDSNRPFQFLNCAISPKRCRLFDGTASPFRREEVGVSPKGRWHIAEKPTSNNWIIGSITLKHLTINDLPKPSKNRYFWSHIGSGGRNAILRGLLTQKNLTYQFIQHFESPPADDLRPQRTDDLRPQRTRQKKTGNNRNSTSRCQFCIFLLNNSFLKGQKPEGLASHVVLHQGYTSNAYEHNCRNSYKCHNSHNIILSQFFNVILCYSPHLCGCLVLFTMQS